MPQKFIVPLSSHDALRDDLVGPKTANLAALSQAGLPTPGGFCLSADAYQAQLAHLDLISAVERFANIDEFQGRRLAVEIRIGLYEQPVAPAVVEPLLDAWHDMRQDSGNLAVVRSSSLIEDRAGANFAGQFESFLGIDSEADFLTAVRSCWAAMWTTNVRRYMTNNNLTPSDSSMAVLIQPLVDALASGGGLSQTAEDEMALSATWGLGSTIAQGEVIPDRIVLNRRGDVMDVQVGHKEHSDTCAHGGESKTAAVPHDLVTEPCLTHEQANELGRYMLRSEDLMGRPVEIEWAMDKAGIKLLQSRPLHVEQAAIPDEAWSQHPKLRGHPGGVGWGVGRAVVIDCECQLSRVAPGDVLVIRIAGPALSHVLPKVSGVVAERGGSTSHLASLARERGIPMVLGVIGATNQIPDGSQVAVDGVAGIVRWVQQCDQEFLSPSQSPKAL